jgi:hypothetical protein
MVERRENEDTALTTMYCYPRRFTLLLTWASCRELTEHAIFQALLRMIPGLEGRILASSDEEIGIMADLVRTIVLAA